MNSYLEPAHIESSPNVSHHDLAIWTLLVHLYTNGLPKGAFLCRIVLAGFRVGGEKDKPK